MIDARRYFRIGAREGKKEEVKVEVAKIRLEFQSQKDYKTYVDEVVKVFEEIIRENYDVYYFDPETVIFCARNKSLWCKEKQQWDEILKRWRSYLREKIKSKKFRITTTIDPERERICIDFK